MNQKELLNKLENLEAKVQLLAERYVSLKKELAATLEENLELKAMVKKQNIQINDFQNKYKISKIVASIAPNAENASELKEKIDEYIVEIDKCIAFLSK
jgi:regulator of replication initiation timing